jgi:hypothetical protein
MISINLSSDYESQLNEIARNENTTISEIVEKAIRLYLNRHALQETPYHLGKDLFGKYGSGKGNLSQNYKKILRKKLCEKHSH